MSATNNRTPATNAPDRRIGPGQGIQSRRTRVIRVEVAPWTIVALVLTVVGLWLSLRLLPVVLVLVMALMIVGMLSPAVAWLEKHRVRRILSIGIVFAALFVAAALIFMLTIPELVNQVRNLIAMEPALRERLANWFAQFPLTLHLSETMRHVQYDALITSSSESLLNFFALVVESVAYGFGAIFLALYMMLDQDRLRGALFSVVPRTHHIRLSRILVHMNTIVGGYIRGQLTTCALMAVFVFILLSACGIPNALVIAVFGGLVDVLPYVGIFLTMGPAVAAALPYGTVIVTVVLVLMLVYEEFESRVLVPVVYGHALRLPSSVVLFALITGATLFGIVGALLALPAAATIIMLIDKLRVELPGETEQTKDTERRKEDEHNELEYSRLTDGMPAEEASAIAVKMSGVRKDAEDNPGA
jgi:predicted PurR-regulated permease PerM